MDFKTIDSMINDSLPAPTSLIAAVISDVRLAKFTMKHSIHITNDWIKRFRVRPNKKEREYIRSISRYHAWRDLMILEHGFDPLIPPK